MTDEQYEQLSCPQPTFVVRSLANDPDYIKCIRCWHYTHEGLHNYMGICDRCCRVLIDAHPDCELVPHILEHRSRDPYFTGEKPFFKQGGKHD